MRKRILAVIAPVLGLLFTLAGPALAADQPTKGTSDITAIPAKAPIVVQIHGYDRAKQRLGAFLSNSLPDIAPKLTRKMDESIKELLEGRETKSFSKDGHIFVILNDLEGISDHPQGAILIPVTGYAAFRDSFLTETERKTVKKEDDGYYSLKPDKLDDSIYLVDRKTAVVITKEKELAKFYAGGDYASLESAIGKGTVKAFLESDLSVYVSIKEINKKYGTQIKSMKTVVPLLLMGAQGIDKKQVELIKQMIDGFLELFDDGEAFVLGFEFREEGANLKMQVQFGDKTETNDFLKNFKPASLSQLGSLPIGQLAYTASNLDFSKSKTLSKLMTEMIAGDDEDEDAKKQIQDAVHELAEQKTTIQLSASNLLKGGLQVEEFADAKKVFAAHLKLMKALTKTSKFAGTPLKEKPTIKEGAETVGNFKLTSANLSFDIEKAVADIPEAAREAAKASLTKMLGDGLKMWFGTDGKKYVQVIAKDFSEAKTILEDYIDGKKTLEKDEGYLATRKQLPAEAGLLMVGDSCRFLQTIIDLVKESAQALPGFPGGAFPDLKAPKAKPAYFGVALTLKSEYASIDLFVPTTAVQQIRKMFAPLLNEDN